MGYVKVGDRRYETKEKMGKFFFGLQYFGRFDSQTFYEIIR